MKHASGGFLYGFKLLSYCFPLSVCQAQSYHQIPGAVECRIQGGGMPTDHSSPSRSRSYGVVTKITPFVELALLDAQNPTHFASSMHILCLTLPYSATPFASRTPNAFHRNASQQISRSELWCQATSVMREITSRPTTAASFQVVKTLQRFNPMPRLRHKIVEDCIYHAFLREKMR
jgi:hypothetical protein